MAARMDYHPRMDSSDVELDSDDRWLSWRALVDRIGEILKEHESVTVGVSEVPLEIDRAEVESRITEIEPRLRHLARMHTLEDDVVFHWTVAELVAHEALHAWWARILEWSLGWWPEDNHGPPPPIPPELA